MSPGSWRTPERDRDLHTTLRLINGLLAIANVIIIGWLTYTVGTWVTHLVT